MKKGEITLDTLVKLVPHVVITIILIAGLSLMIYMFYAQERPIEEQDFTRVVAELDIMLKEEYMKPYSLTVPIDSESPLDMIMYPRGQSPKICQNQACFCLYYVQDDKRKERCQLYEKIPAICATECGPVCITSTKRVELKPEQSTLTITRGCNEITFT